MSILLIQPSRLALGCFEVRFISASQSLPALELLDFYCQ